VSTIITKQKLLNTISAHPKLVTLGIGLAITMAIGTAITGMVDQHHLAFAAQGGNGGCGGCGGSSFGSWGVSNGGSFGG
jgi:hypothetical protein